MSMVQVDVPMAFAVGAFFSDAAGEALRAGGVAPRLRLHLYNLVYQIFFFSWVPIYFLLNYFGWETTHIWWHAGSVDAYPYYVPIFIGVFFAAGIAGCAIGARWIVAGRRWAVRWLYGAMVAFSAVWIFSQYQRTFRLGSYAEWKAGKAPWFYEDSTFLAMLIFTLLWWAGGLVIFGKLLCRQRREPLGSS